MSKESSMSEVAPGALQPATDEATAGPVTTSAGAMLRSAREARGLALDQLANLLKVPERKLELLEADRHAELPGNAFVRSLAMSVARQLGLDPQQVLAALPGAEQAPQALENVSRGLATPYREPISRVMTSGGPPEWLRPAVIAPALLLLLALLFWFAPPMRTLFSAVGGSVADGADAAASKAAEISASSVALAVQAASEVPAAAASAVQALSAGAGAAASAPPVPPAVVDTVHSAPQDEPSASAPLAAASGAVVLRTTAESWVEVRDGAGSVLLSRMLLPGEAVGLDGKLPMKLKIGNADGTRVSLRGQPVDLQPFTRDNVARVDLK